MDQEQEDMFRESGAPKRHRRWDGHNSCIPWGKALFTLQKMYGTGCLVALLGQRGPGKTQLGVEMIRRAIEDGKKARYLRLMQMFIDVRSTYGNQDRREWNERVVLDSVTSPALLVLDETYNDDLAKDGAYKKDWEFRMLTHLIDVRYSECRDTILIANATVKQFEDFVGSTVVSRINGSGGILVCDWPSFRET